MSTSRGRGGGRVCYPLRIYPQLSSCSAQASCCVAASKDSTAAEVVREAVTSLCLDNSKSYVLVEVKETGGEEWALDAADAPVHRVLLWPRRAQGEHPREDGHYFLLRELEAPGTPAPAASPPCASAARRLAERGLLPRRPADLDDLCDLPELSEEGLLCSLRQRFLQHKIYTYAGSILVAVNPFKFLPIYNPKYVKMYENQRLGQLEPHVFALADVAFHAMLRKRTNQCLVISGESGSGKTQTTNFLIHCLTALSQKGHASGVERTILGAGPVLEAFGNAKTAHNNNSSRFGKFIQVNYLESGVVRGAVVEKYLLEKSRLVSQEKDERNYHVFYYLLLGVSEDERRAFRLLQPQDYFYLNQHDLKIEDGEDLKHDFERLKQAMEMVGFLPATKRQIFAVLSAILYLGNVTYKKRASGRDEGLEVGPPEVLDTLSQLLKVKREILVEVLTKRKTVTANDKLILPYSLSEAITARDSMAKSLYSALFDWIVLRINHALLNKKDMEEAVSCLSIGVLDIFGFEDFERNSFEQFCINYANEQLQYYFNQHIFKLEQEEYQSEGISWHHIEYTDNVGCIQLISKKPTGLFYLLDEESNFPRATSQTLLAKFKQQHEDNRYFLGTPVLEPAFIIQHFAGRVKYQIKDFREKNMDYMRPDIVALLRGSDSSFVRQLIGMDPVAVFRWAVLRAAIRSMAVLREAGRLRAERAEKAAAAEAASAGTGPQNPPGEPQRVTGTPSEKLYRKSKGIKPKQTIPKNLLDSKSLRLIISMTLHDRTTKSLLHLHKKKKPPSISAQFQASLNKLLETLGKAEPFFIRCIRSNAEKKELCFDEELVLQQLRYTGMLETVRIRRSGYSAKYTFQDFTKQFQALLPKDAQPCREVIAALLQKMDMAPGGYQIGRTKVFLKEAQRQLLQETLHREVVRRILLLQRWFRTLLERRRFLALRRAAVTIQACWRSYRTRRTLQQVQAAVFLQAAWRGYRQRTAYLRQRQGVVRLQSLCRGHLQRQSFRQMVAEKREAEVDQAARCTVGAQQERTPGPAQEQVVGLKAERSDEAPEIPQPESEIKIPGPLDVAAAPKTAADSHEKQASSREKRESRRQRGLEHVQFQNKHMQAAREPSAGAKSRDGAAGSGPGRRDRATLGAGSELDSPSGPESKDGAILEAGSKLDCPSGPESKDGAILEASSELDSPARPESRDGATLEAGFELDSPSGPESRDGATVGAESNDGAAVGLCSKLDSPTKAENRDRAALAAGLELDMPTRIENRHRTAAGAGSEPDSASALAPGSPTSGETPRAPLERPTSLALDMRGSTLATGSTPKAPKDKKPGVSPGAQEQPESPSGGGGTCLIQRYRDQDTERLASAVETWRGKKRAATGPGTMLSQSLDLGLRGSGAPSSPSQERRPSLPAGDMAKVLPSLTQPRVQPPAETPDGDPGSRRLTQKKKFSDTTAGADAGLSPGPPADSKSAFKRLFQHKSKDKKYSLESTEDAEGAGPSHSPLEAAAKKNLEAPASEKPTKEPGGKGRKSRALKVGRITVSERWRESVFRQITNANELKFLDEFLLNKVNDLRSQKTPIESLFIEATERFRSNLKTMYSVPNGKIHVGYKDLMENYHIVVSSLAAERGEKDPNLVLNLFQSLLDEFTRRHTKSDFEPPKSKAQKKKRKQERAVQQHNGHVFASYQVSIPQSCEQCLSYIWLMDKALLCSVCKMTCHKKCVPRIQTYCSYTSGSKLEPGTEPGHFGVCVDSLTSDKASVPVVLEKLLEHVEMHGLYTEGLYRKSGAANRTRELRQALQIDPTAVQLENFPIHAITGVLKQWLRELPEPLMTFAQYSDFLRAVELPEKQEQLAAIYNVLEHLPEANHKSLERLVFHLVKVALLEDVNRMSPGALAIIFAPCLLRCPDNSDPLTSMKDVLKVTACVEMLIKEQMRKYKVKMEEISQLEAAESIAFRRLSFLRQNSPWPLRLGFSSPYEGVLGKSPKARTGGSGGGSGSPEELGALLEEEEAAGDEDQEKEILIEQIQSIKEEKEDIAYRLPELDPRGSDEENVDSETSASTESLLEERGGRGGAAEGPPAPGIPCPSTPAPSPFPMAGAPPRRRPSCSLTVRVKMPRRTPIMPTANIKLPPGLASHLAGLAQGTQQAAVLVRRREPPARRPDLVHSVYIAPSAHLPAQGPHEPLDMDEQLPGARRRYSDPPTYCLPPAAGQANG